MGTGCGMCGTGLLGEPAMLQCRLSTCYNTDQSHEASHEAMKRCTSLYHLAHTLLVSGNRSQVVYVS